MATAKQMKAREKEAICRKLVTALKKRYRQPLPKSNRDVLQTMLYSICLEDNTASEGTKLYDRLIESFHDLNEIRVSSISELEAVFHDTCAPEWRALRVRAMLQHIFESRWEFNFELIRRKTFDQANQLLGRIKELSPFVRLHTLQATLGSHVVPVDERMGIAATWLGLLNPKTDPRRVHQELKSAVRKNDVANFCHVLRLLANDPKVAPLMAKQIAKAPDEGYDLDELPERLEALFKLGDAPPRRRKAVPKKAVKKKAVKKKAGKKKAAKKTTKKSAKAATKKAAKKADRRKAAVKKKSVKKTVSSQSRSKKAKKGGKASAAKTKRVVTKKITRKTAGGKSAQARKRRK